MTESLQYTEPNAWLDALTRDFRAIFTESNRIRGSTHIALSGGSTPKAWYERLNSESLPWTQLEWWLGDERWVPPTDGSSNERMARESLGKGRPEFGEHFHSWHRTSDPETSALEVEKDLIKNLGAKPALDLVLLGLGNDGHVASLFPGTAALNESSRLAVANLVPQMNATRLTLTFPMLNAAREVWFLVQGRGKEEMVRRLLSGDTSIPGGCVCAARQKLFWLMD